MGRLRVQGVFQAAAFDVHLHDETAGLPSGFGECKKLPPAHAIGSIHGTITVFVRRAKGLKKLLDVIARLETAAVILDRVACLAQGDVATRGASIDGVHDGFKQGLFGTPSLAFDHRPQQGWIHAKFAAFGATYCCHKASFPSDVENGV